MSVEFHPEALAEFCAAAEYYEQQQTALGGRFVNAVEMAVTMSLIPHVLPCHRGRHPSQPDESFSLRGALRDRTRSYSCRSSHALPPQTGILVRAEELRNGIEQLMLRSQYLHQLARTLRVSYRAAFSLTPP
ncbi:hypothetical protein V6O07_07450, partial [Arthrospira platensis SPKY2]